MRSFAEIWAEAAALKRGEAALDALLPVPLAAEALAAIPDDRWLSTLSRAVFSAGFTWRVVADKWPGFEAAFAGFEPGRCAMMDDEALEAAAKAGGIPHMAKARAIRDNAVLFRALAEDHGSAAAALAFWPAEDFAGLLAMLKNRGGRLGGASPLYALRMMGRDGWILSEDVTAALIREGVIDKPAGSTRAMAAVQVAFNAWRVESGRPLMQISRVLAASVG